MPINKGKISRDSGRHRLFYDNRTKFSYDSFVKLQLCPFGGEKKFRQEMIKPIEFFSNDKILDMCCGTGNVTFAIREKVGENAEIIGIDLSSNQIQQAKKINRFRNVKFIEGDATRTNFESDYFDKVVIPHALHEMPRKTQLKVLAEIRRILKNGGKVIVLEEDIPGNILLRLILGIWFWYWLPASLNFETPSRRSMFKHGVVNELKEVNFKNIQKISKYHGSMQIVIGEK